MQIKKDKYNLGKSEEIEITLKDYDKKANIMLNAKIDEINIGASISGIVVNNFNIPIKNAIVKLMNNKLELLVAVRTDKEGKYDINMIPTSDIYTLLVSATGKVLEQSPSFSLMNVENKIINFNLNNDEKSILGAINGILINDNNKAIIGAVISLYKINLNSDELVAITYSDYDGEFIFSELQPGNYEVIISALKYLPLEEVISVESNKISSFKKSLTIDPHLSNGSISGVITDNLNIAMPKADVILYKLDENNKQIPVAFTKTNFSGIYNFGNVPFGSYFIKSNAIQNITMNNILTPSVKITSTKEIDTYNTSTGVLENGAQVDYLTGFVTSLGGVNDGAVTLNVTVEEAGLYNLAIQYTSADFNRPLRLEVNGKDNGEIYKVPITSGWETFHTKIFYVLTSLNKGVNIIKFHGDGVNLAPNLSMVTLILNQTESVTLFNTSSSEQTKSKTYNVALGNFVGSVKVNTKTNFAEGIGGVIDSSSTLTVDVVDKAVYYLAVKYLATSTNLNFMVYVNNVNNMGNGKVYTVMQTKSMNISDALTFTLPIVLNAKSNTIQFHGDGKTYAPYFGEFTLSLPPVTSNLVEGILENGARADTTNRFVRALGGKKDGSSTITVNVSNAGEYTLSIQYLGTDNTLPLKIDINGMNNKTIYTLPPTKSLTMKDIKTFTIPLTLNTGNNTLRFYGNGKDSGPNLSTFTLTATNSVITPKPNTSTIVNDVYFIANATTGGTAILDKKQNLITGIGGKGNGFFTMEISVKTEGEYVLRIAYRNNYKNFKIDINEKNTGKTYKTIGDFNDSLSILINLKSGKNTLKFYGNGTELAPDFGDFELNLNYPINSRLSEGIFSGDTKLLPSGVINSIGGFFDNYFQINYFASYYGKYSLDIIFSSNGGTLLIDINDISTGSVYNIPSAKTATVAYSTAIMLEEGDNSIKFYGIRKILVPDIHAIDIKPLDLFEENEIYNFSNAILENGIKTSTITNLVTWQGEGNKGTITANIKVNSEDLYDLNIEYISPYWESILYLNVNKENSNTKHYLPITGKEGNSKFEIFTIKGIKLNSGDNSLKFFADPIISAPKLKSFSIAKSEILTNTIPYGTFYAKDGVLANGAKVTKFSKNFIDNLGGVTQDGSVTIKYNAEYDGLYDLTIEYLVIEDNKNLLIEINGIDTGEIYTLVKTKTLNEMDSQTFIVPVLLTKEENIIKFHGDNNSFSIALGKILINKSPEISTYNFIDSELENGAAVNTNTGFVSNLGGYNNGIATVKVYAEMDGNYYLTMKYISVDNSSIRIDVNDEPLNASLSRNLKFFNLTKTKSENISDAKTITKIIKLKSGKNYIKFYNTEKSYLTPKLGTFVISTNEIIKTFPIGISNLSKGASLSIIEGFANGIGGIRKGAVTIMPNMEKSGLYNVAFRYISQGMTRSIKVAINKDYSNAIKYRLPSTGKYLDENYAKTFTIPVNLKKGKNIIKFYKDFSITEGPEIGEITISEPLDTPDKIYKISEGTLKGAAAIDNISNMVTNIGGVGKGEVTITVNVLSNSIYTLKLQYISNNQSNNLLIDVNEKSTRKIYDLPITLSGNSAEIFSIDLNLNAGNNNIRLYGDIKNNGLLLGNITLSTAIVSSKVLMDGEYNCADGILEKGATIDTATGFVTNIGGKEKGSCTINVKAYYSGLHVLLIEYIAPTKSNVLEFDINNTPSEKVYIVEQTEFEAKYLEFTVFLTKGNNKIKFYAPIPFDESKANLILGPDLGIIKVLPR